MHLHRLPVVVSLLFAATTAAAAGKPCEDLKAEIAAKLDARGVKAYTLNILPADEPSDRKEVGRCEGGTKKIVYARA